MRQWNDAELLSAYAHRHSEEAFGVLVERYIALVYSAALRQVQNPHLAEEVTQAAFAILAQKARRLNGRTVLSGWLCRTAHFVARNALKTELRRHYREQEAHMQSLINEPASAAWQQLAPLLDEAVAQLNEADRNAVVLRFYERKPLTEVATALGIDANAAQKRVSRALEKLRKIFARHGVNSTTGVIAETISANSVQAVPLALAKTATAVALAKGATAPISTLTLIKGALKIMAWTKAKTTVVAVAGALIAAGTTTITVKEIQEHKTYPWQVHEGTIEDAQVEQPPQVRILRSKFHIADEADINGKMIGTGVSAKEVVASAYGFVSSARAVYSAELPGGTYDYIACLPDGGSVNAKALQVEVKRVFGVVGRTETRNTNVWLLKVKFSNALTSKRDAKPYHGESFQAIPGGIRFVDKDIPGVTFALESYAGIPVGDETSLTNRYDFDLNCTPDDLKSRNLDYINLVLGELGLELVPTNMPIEMLVVEKAN